MKRILKIRRNKIIGLIILFFLLSFINIKCKIISIPLKGMIDYQFDIVTICTVFAGFSFTVLGILISLSSSKTMDNLAETNILKEQCSTIVDSIVFFIISTFTSMIFILSLDKNVIDLLDFVYEYDFEYMVESLLFIEDIGFLLFGIIYFVKSVKGMIVLMNKIFYDNQENGRIKVQRYKETEKIIKEKMIK